MNPLSPYTAYTEIEIKKLNPLVTICKGFFSLDAYLTNDSLWFFYTGKDESSIGFRAAFSPSGNFYFVEHQEIEGATRFNLECLSFKCIVQVEFFQTDLLTFRYQTSIIPKINLLIPNVPKDILTFDKHRNLSKNGKIHTKQAGTRSGIIFFDDQESNSTFYFQNLTAINDYFETTETSAKDVVGGTWPEIGFSLPSATKPLRQGKNYTVSDAFVRITDYMPLQTSEVSKAFLNHLAEIYILIPRPEPHFHDWLQTVEKGVSDLTNHKGSWTFAGGHNYLNAYVADYKSPPEVMVQLAVLLPLIEYISWKGESDHILISNLKAGLPSFYQKDMNTIVRWLPALEGQLDYSEEQKQPRVMDSWYLHHPLMNLARLSEMGDAVAQELLINSIDYVINVARTFDYQWPVFYQMDTLKVLKAETAEGDGGEKDVPGTYADLMLRVWRLTGKDKYLQEAIKSAEKLKGLGFNIFYQANNTAFSAGAMLRLFKQTNDEAYLDLSYDCLAGIFNNVQLWECKYGYGKYFRNFFAIFPLKDAPYTAAYEEQEVYSALHDYLQEAEGIKILDSVRLLISEFIRHMVGRVSFYYPPILSKGMLSNKVKTGEVDQALWIAVEDLQDGWEQSGQVGQEVYGAGVAFGVIPRQYLKLNVAGVIIYCDYPMADLKITHDVAEFRTLGDPRLSCSFRLILNSEATDYKFFILVDDKIKLAPYKRTVEYLEFRIFGNQKVSIHWKDCIEIANQYSLSSILKFD